MLRVRGIARGHDAPLRGKISAPQHLRAGDIAGPNAYKARDFHTPQE